MQQSLRSMLLLLLLLLQWQSSTAIFRPVIPRLGCYIRFALFRFKGGDYSQYDRYFRGDSRMILAQAGIYKGADGIEEYAKFADHPSPYVEDAASVDYEVKFNGYDRKNKMCEFFILDDSFYHMEPDLTTLGSNETLRLASMYKFQFHYRKRYIKNFWVYYESTSLDYYFGDLLSTNGTREYVCSIYEGDACNEIILDPPADCLAQMEALPVTDPNAYVDGNSQACRVMHATFAAENSQHCAHISFDPMADANGDIKCQTSANMTSDAFFSDGDVNLFHEFMVKRGFDPEVGYFIEARQ